MELKLLRPLNLLQLAWLLGWYTLCVFFSKASLQMTKGIFLGEKCGAVGVGGKGTLAWLESRILHACFFFFFLNLIIKCLQKRNPRGGQGKWRLLVSEIALHVGQL